MWSHIGKAGTAALIITALWMFWGKSGEGHYKAMVVSRGLADIRGAWLAVPARCESFGVVA